MINILIVCVFVFFSICTQKYRVLFSFCTQMYHMVTHKWVGLGSSKMVVTFIRVGGSFNILRPTQNVRRFADDVFICVFLNENIGISFTISLTFVPEVWINNIPALVQIMAWRRLGDMPLSEPTMVCLPTHICVTRLQWVNIFKYHHWGCLNNPIFSNLGYVLHVEHISRVITHGAQHLWVTPSPLPIAL